MFLQDYDLDEARAKLLEKLDKVLEAADIHAKSGNTLKAVEMLTTPDTHSVDHMRRAIEYLLTGLRQDLTLGVLPTTNLTSVKLLRLAERLDKSAMTEQEVNEVRSFHSSSPRALHLSAFSLQCTKQSNVQTTQVSARSPIFLLGLETILLLCCA